MINSNFFVAQFTMRYQFAKTLITLLTLLLLIVCTLMTGVRASLAEPPTDADVETYLRQIVSKGTSIKNVKAKSFMDNNTGYGRTSVSGDLVLEEDRYKETKVLWDDLQRLGLSNAEIGRFGKNLGHFPPQVLVMEGKPFNFSTYEISRKKGETLHFSGDLSFVENAEGFSFSYHINGIVDRETVTIGEIDAGGLTNSIYN